MRPSSYSESEWGFLLTASWRFVLLEPFEAGGHGMILTLIGGLALLAACLRYALRAESRDFPLVVCLGAFTLMAGALGFLFAVRNLFEAVGHVDPADRMVILVVGIQEAAYNLFLAFSLIILAALVASVGALRSSFRVKSGAAVGLPRGVGEGR